MIDKTVRSVAEALADIRDGATVLCAGFAMVGEPHILLDVLVEQEAKDLTIVSNTIGSGREGVARLIQFGRGRGRAGVLYHHLRRHDPGRGEGTTEFRRPGLCAGTGDRRRRGADRGMAGGLLGDAEV